MVREADPGFTRSSLQPWVYEASNGRRFIDAIPVYTPNAVVGIETDLGVPITDDLGNVIVPT
jgi:hypothetical protein